MKNFGQQGPNPFMFRFKQAKPPGLFGLFFILAGTLFLLVFGVGMLMLAATLAVVLLPWLWWKRRQFMQRMAQAQAQQQTMDPSSSGVVIEGEVLQSTVHRDRTLE